MRTILLTLLALCLAFALKAQVPDTVKGSYDLWGVNPTGGTDGLGSIFRIDSAGNHYKEEYSFKYDHPFDANENSKFVEYNNLLWGITVCCGDYGKGSLYNFNPVDTAYNRVYSFKLDAGEQLMDAFVIEDGVFYGLIWGKDSCRAISYDIRKKVFKRLFSVKQFNLDPYSDKRFGMFSMNANKGYLNIVLLKLYEYTSRPKNLEPNTKQISTLRYNLAQEHLYLDSMYVNIESRAAYFNKNTLYIAGKHSALSYTPGQSKPENIPYPIGYHMPRQSTAFSNAAGTDSLFLLLSKNDSTVLSLFAYSIADKKLTLINSAVELPECNIIYYYKYARNLIYTKGVLYAFCVDKMSVADGGPATHTRCTSYNVKTGAAGVIFKPDNDGRHIISSSIYFKNNLYFLFTNVLNQNKGAVLYKTGQLNDKAIPVFNAGTNDGKEPQRLLSGNGMLYGTCKFGGNSVHGTAFSYNPVTGAFTKIYNFNRKQGCFPRPKLYMISKTLYGFVDCDWGWGSIGSSAQSFGVNTAGNQLFIKKHHAFYKQNYRFETLHSYRDFLFETGGLGADSVLGRIVLGASEISTSVFNGKIYCLSDVNERAIRAMLYDSTEKKKEIVSRIIEIENPHVRHNPYGVFNTVITANEQQAYFTRHYNGTERIVAVDINRNKARVLKAGKGKLYSPLYITENNIVFSNIYKGRGRFYKYNNKLGLQLLSRITIDSLPTPDRYTDYMRRACIGTLSGPNLISQVTKGTHKILKTNIYTGRQNINLRLEEHYISIPTADMVQYPHLPFGQLR